jgi:hypothetical protein
MADKKPKKKASVIRIDDFKDLSEREQVERVKEMLRSLGKPSKNTNRG